MRHVRTGSKRATFKHLTKSRSAQAATMVLQPGQDTGKPENEHPRSEQWLFVVSGTGQALVNRRNVSIKAVRWC